jgi:hypothetical protein
MHIYKKREGGGGRESIPTSFKKLRGLRRREGWRESM